MWKSLTSFVLIFSIVSCASTTRIETYPAGAGVYADGNYLGQSPVSYSDMKLVGSSTAIEIRKEGCRDTNATISRSEKLDIGALIAGLFVLIPFLWIMEYNPRHTYKLECEPAAQS